MKSALVYLTLKKLKNQIKGIFKSPAKLVYALVMIALLALVIFSGNMEDSELLSDGYRPLSELTAVVCVFLSLILRGKLGEGRSSKKPEVCR